MKRRAFLAFLGLPAVLPFARAARRVSLKLRKPVWTVSLNLVATAPLDIVIRTETATVRRLVLPEKGRQVLTVPMYCARPGRLMYSVESAAPVKFYSVEVDLTAPLPTGEPLPVHRA